MTGEFTDKYLNDAITSEHDHCVTKHGPFKNHHEAYGVMKEEMEEVQGATELFNGRAMRSLDVLWMKIKDDDMAEAVEYVEKIYDTAEELVKEGIQVMAMCWKWRDLINREQDADEKQSG